MPRASRNLCRAPPTGTVSPISSIRSRRCAIRRPYLRELRNRFGNLGLAAAAYNAGPSRVSAWLASHRPLPRETRNYVAIVTGWTADEWASPSPPQNAETAVPQGLPCTRLANLILAPKQEAQRIATYMPRWGVQLAAHLSESRAWAIYRERQKRFASLIARECYPLMDAPEGCQSVRVFAGNGAGYLRVSWSWTADGQLWPIGASTRRFGSGRRD